MLGAKFEVAWEFMGLTQIIEGLTRSGDYTLYVYIFVFGQMWSEVEEHYSTSHRLIILIVFLDTP